MYTGTEDGNYCLVSFHEEDSMAVVPFKKIMHVSEVQLKEGDVVNVLWNDKRQYPATFLMKGILNLLCIRMYKATSNC